MTCFETIPGIRGRKMKKNGGGVNSRMKYLTHCKNFGKCHQCTLSEYNNIKILL
jgi:hypothetical protein